MYDLLVNCKELFLSPSCFSQVNSFISRGVAMKSVFVCHSTSDKKVADIVVDSLENEGISTWIAPRDIASGSDYGASIGKGIRECEVLVLVFSKMSNESEAVIREVQLAFNEKKAIIPFRIEDVPVSDSMAFYLSGLHWVDAVQKKKNLDVLLKDVKDVLQNLGKEIKGTPLLHKHSPVPSSGRSKSILVKRTAIAAVCTLLLIIAGLFILLNSGGNVDLVADVDPQLALFYAPNQNGAIAVGEPTQEEELVQDEVLYQPVVDVTPEVAQVAVGDIIQFGLYDWLVLDVQGNQALIITEGTVLLSFVYHMAVRDVTWETSHMRHWLNGEIFYTEFSWREQARIAETYVINNNNPWDFLKTHGYANAPGGNNTVDRLFLLSIDEVLRYFGDSGLVAEGAAMGVDERYDIEPQLPDWGIYWFGIHDQYSEARMTHFGDSPSWWWLRSPGASSGLVSYVGRDGRLSLSGRYATRPLDAMPIDGPGGVRPALFLYLYY